MFTNLKHFIRSLTIYGTHVRILPIISQLIIALWTRQETSRTAGIAKLTRLANETVRSTGESHSVEVPERRWPCSFGVAGRGCVLWQRAQYSLTNWFISEPLNGPAMGLASQKSTHVGEDGYYFFRSHCDFLFARGCACSVIASDRIWIPGGYGIIWAEGEIFMTSFVIDLQCFPARKPHGGWKVDIFLWREHITVKVTFSSRFLQANSKCFALTTPGMPRRREKWRLRIIYTSQRKEAGHGCDPVPAPHPSLFSFMIWAPFLR